MLGATVLIDSQRMQTEVGQEFAHLLMSVEQTSMAARADDDDGFGLIAPLSNVMNVIVVLGTDRVLAGFCRCL